MPEKTDDFTGPNCYIITIPSEGSLHLYGNDPREIRIDDIANALSHQCRFTGHMQPGLSYSVAEHCVDVANLVKMWGGGIEEQRSALMHDSPEYGLSDIAAPFKRELGNYYEKEALIWRRIAAKYGLTEVVPNIVKDADFTALFIEAMTFVVPDNHGILINWVGYEKYGKLASELWEGDQLPFWKQKYKMGWHGLSQEKARIAYLEKFKELFHGAEA